MSGVVDHAAVTLMRSQRAYRSFGGDDVPDRDLATIIEVASHAPSAENRQPWIFIVVSDAEVRHGLDDLTRRIWRQAGQAHSRDSLSPRFFSEVDSFFDRGYGGAPRLIVVAADGRNGQSRSVLAASVFPAIQNLLLAALALGYGSSMTTLAAQAPAELQQLLSLPANVYPLAVVPIGRPSSRLGPPRRRPVRDIAFVDRFGNPLEASEERTGP